MFACNTINDMNEPVTGATKTIPAMFSVYLLHQSSIFKTPTEDKVAHSCAVSLVRNDKRTRFYVHKNQT